MMSVKFLGLERKRARMNSFYTGFSGSANAHAARRADLCLFHPDYTVGFGIAPKSAYNHALLGVLAGSRTPGSSAFRVEPDYRQ